MPKRILRQLLITFAIIVFIGQFLYVILPFFVPSYEVPTEDYGGKFAYLMRVLSYFFVSLPLPILSLWAAHNLKPLVFITDKALKQSLILVSFLVAFSLLIEGVRFFKEMAPYFPEFVLLSASSYINSANWFLYSIAEIALMFFAVFQLNQKMASVPLSGEKK